MDNILLFSTRDELTRIRLERVMYFEADANYTKVVFSNGVTATLLTSLVHLEKLIAGVLIEKNSIFVRIGKRYIINSAYLFQINVLRQRLVLSDLASPYTAKLSVSKDALRKLKALYTTPVRRSAADVEGVQPRPDGEAVSQ
jgi:DNA-binding LytR/AlgR family response regulator